MTEQTGLLEFVTLAGRRNGSLSLTSIQTMSICVHTVSMRWNENKLFNTLASELSATTATF